MNELEIAQRTAARLRGDIYVPSCDYDNAIFFYSDKSEEGKWLKISPYSVRLEGNELTIRLPNMELIPNDKMAVSTFEYLELIMHLQKLMIWRLCGENLLLDIKEVSQIADSKVVDTFTVTAFKIAGAIINGLK